MKNFVQISLASLKCIASNSNHSSQLPFIGTIVLCVVTSRCSSCALVHTSGSGDKYIRSSGQLVAPPTFKVDQRKCEQVSVFTKFSLDKWRKEVKRKAPRSPGYHTHLH